MISEAGTGGREPALDSKTARSYTAVEKGVIQLAANILQVPYSAVLGLSLPSDDSSSQPGPYAPPSPMTIRALEHLDPAVLQSFDASLDDDKDADFSAAFPQEFHEYTDGQQDFIEATSSQQPPYDAYVPLSDAGGATFEDLGAEPQDCNISLGQLGNTNGSHLFSSTFDIGSTHDPTLVLQPTTTVPSQSTYNTTLLANQEPDNWCLWQEPTRSARALPTARALSKRRIEPYPSRPSQFRAVNVQRQQQHQDQLVRKRKDNVCVRCRLKRIKCIPNANNARAPCDTCINAMGATIVRMPCMRYRITDTKLLDKGPHPRVTWTRRWTSMSIIEVETWVSPHIKTITLTQDIADAKYDVQVRQFQPLPGDSHEKQWKTNGQLQTFLCAPYAIANMHETARDIAGFVDNHIATFIRHYVRQSDHLLSNTYEMIHRQSMNAERPEEKHLMRSVLKLWVASRMESKQERICSDETLGMPPQDWDPLASNFNHVCVPPVMEAQIEIITTATILLPMNKEVLRCLNKLIDEHKVQSWFTVYLVMFVLLHSCGLLTKAESVRAQRENPVGDTARYHNPALVKEFHLGAKIMLAHFHVAAKGCQPFSMDWAKRENATFAQLNPEQVQFVRDTIADVQERDEMFRRIRHEKAYEHEYFFISQMYDPAWDGSSIDVH